MLQLTCTLYATTFAEYLPGYRLPKGLRSTGIYRVLAPIVSHCIRLAAIGAYLTISLEFGQVIITVLCKDTILH